MYSETWGYSNCIKIKQQNQATRRLKVICQSFLTCIVEICILASGCIITRKFRYEVNIIYIIKYT